MTAILSRRKRHEGHPYPDGEIYKCIQNFGRETAREAPPVNLTQIWEYGREKRYDILCLKHL
jgi:hypothetical protein